MGHESHPLPDRRGVALRLAGAAAVLALLGLALTSLPGLGDVRERLAGASVGWLTGALALTLGPAAVAGAAIAAVLLLPRLRFSPGRGRFGLACSRGETALSDGVLEARRLVGSGSIAVLAGAFGYMALDVAALAAAFAAIGSVPPIGILALGYALGQLGGLIPLPGGIGGADTGVVGALVLYGVALPEATAAVLAYRAFQLGLPAVLGSIALLRLPRALGAAASRDLQGLARPLANPVLAA